jgi:hypothetical protein
LTRYTYRVITAAVLLFLGFVGLPPQVVEATTPTGSAAASVLAVGSSSTPDSNWPW